MAEPTVPPQGNRNASWTEVISMLDYSGKGTKAVYHGCWI